MATSIGGFLGISYQEESSINIERVMLALQCLNLTVNGVDIVMQSMLSSPSKETGFTFSGNTEHLQRCLDTIKGSGVEIETIRQPPTPEMEKMLQDILN